MTPVAFLSRDEIAQKFSCTCSVLVLTKKIFVLCSVLCSLSADSPLSSRIYEISHFWVYHWKMRFFKIWDPNSRLHWRTLKLRIYYYSFFTSMLVTGVGDGLGLFGHQHPLSFTTLASDIKIQKMSPTSTNRHQL